MRFALLIGAVLMAPLTAYAQLGMRSRGDEAAQEQILLAPRALTRLLREGKLAIEEKRYSDGIAALGALLLEEGREDLPEETLRQDYFIEAGGDSYYKSSVRGEALRLLGSIPEEGRKTLEIQYGVAARQSLQAAVAARDIDAIREVTRKYYHTEAGYDASVLLAQDKLVRGFPVAAASILQRLSEFPAARKRFGAQLIGEAAGAWVQAGRMDLAIGVLTQGEQLFAGASVMLGSRQVSFGASQDWKQLLAQVYPTQSRADERSLKNWLTTGGEPARNGTASAGLPLPMVAWDVKLHRTRGDEEAVNTIAARESQSNAVLMPKLEARMIGDIVLAKTATSNIFAIDLATGLRLWPFYKDRVPVDLTPRQSHLPADVEEAFLSKSLRNRIWGSSAFGQFTVDSNHLYYISGVDDQQFSQPTFNNPMVRSAAANNYLTGVSLQGQGKEIWHVGGAESEYEPALAGAYFLGPPLSFEGDLYALVEINLETRLVVLDARTGKQQWSQQLTLSPTLPIRNDQLRQSQALSPSISDSVVVCPVGNGAIIAVDLLTRSLMWAKQYMTDAAPRNQFTPFNNFGESPDPYEPTAERWQEPQVVIHKGQIVFTPPESSTILCIDLLTGVPRWQQARGMARYVAGVHDDQIVIVSNTEVFAYNLSDGRPSWSGDIPLTSRLPNTAERAPAQSPTNSSGLTGSRERETVAGKSVRDGKYLYVPTSARRVLKIDLDAGRLVDSATVEQPLGNLFSFKDRLISVGTTRITAYYTRDALTQEVKQRLAANAQDTWALNQQALLLIADHRIKEAIELLRKSFAIDPEDGETRYMLVSALLTGLEEDFSGYLSIATELEPIIESQHFRFLVLLARGNLRSGEYELAFSRLMELVRERSRSRQPSLQARVETMMVDSGYEVDVDTWIAAQLGEAFDRAEPKQRERMLKLVQERLTEAGNSHPVTREMELRFLAWLEAAQPALLAVAEGLLGDADQTMGERLLQPILFSNNQALRQRARALMKLNARADDEALMGYSSDVVTISPDGRLVPVENAQFMTPADIKWPSGMIEAKIGKLDAPAITQIQGRIKQTGTRYGRPRVEIGLSHDHLTIANELGRAIGSCEFERSMAEGTDNFLRCQVDGGLIYLETQTELIAFDMYRARTSPQDACLWRYSLARVPSGHRTQHNRPTSQLLKNPLEIETHSRGTTREAIVGPITPTGILIQKETDVVLLSPLTGNKLWSRGGYDDRTTLVADGLDIAVIHPSSGKIDILDCRDGSMVRQLDYAGEAYTWFTAGKNVIQYVNREVKAPSNSIQVEAANGTAIRVLNAFTGELLLEREFAPFSRADSSDDRYVVVLEPSGKLWYCDAETCAVSEHQIPLQPKLDRVRLQRFGERLIVLTSLASGSSGPLIKILPEADDSAISKGLYPVNGNIIGLSVEDGKLLWDRPGTLLRFTFPNSQPRHSPYMACYRVLQSSGSRLAQVALVDLRDGTLAYSNTNLSLTAQPSNESYEFAMELQPERPSVRVSIGTHLLILRPTDEEKPPQPVCFFGALPAPRRQINQNFDPFNPSK